MAISGRPIFELFSVICASVISGGAWRDLWRGRKRKIGSQPAPDDRESWLDQLPVLSWEAEPTQWRTSFVGRRVESLLGFSRDRFELDPTLWRELVHPDDRTALHSAVAAAIESGEELTHDHRMFHSEGRYIWVRQAVRVVLPANGGPARLLGVVFEITREAEMQRELRRSAEQLRSMFDNAVLGIFRCSTDGRLIDTNQALLRILGFDSAQELAALDPATQIYRGREEQDRVFQALLSDQAQSGVDVEWRRRCGRIIVVRIAGRPLRNLAGDVIGFEGMVEDVTTQRSLEQRLVDSQKIEAIGRLAGGIAHDFNNLLTVISGYGSLLAERIKHDEEGYRFADGMLRAADRAGGLTQQLLAFSRRQILQPKVLQINSVVADLDRMLRRLIGEDIELVTLLDPSLPPVRVDPAQLEQVVMNLVLNARDAIASPGGQVTIESSRLSIEAGGSNEFPELSSGEFVVLSVKDNGHGIDEETRAHLFEPFFTTKPPSRGNGLGLATVYGVVHQSGGAISVRSEVGVGSQFHVALPASFEPLAPVETERQGSSPSGTETVLVVEDEEAVRTLTSHVLRSKGYNVLEARHGADALTVAASFPQPIQLLLTDLVMPHLGGRDLAARLVPARAGMKVLFVSGYDDQMLFGAGDLLECSDFLQKPFSPDTLARKVRDLLDRS